MDNFGKRKETAHPKKEMPLLLSLKKDRIFILQKDQEPNREASCMATRFQKRS